MSQAIYQKKIRDKSSFLVDPIITTVCKFLGIEVPKFIQKQSLNELIEARQSKGEHKVVQQNLKEESWCAYVQRRALECLSIPKNEKEL